MDFGALRIGIVFVLIYACVVYSGCETAAKEKNPAQVGAPDDPEAYLKRIEAYSAGQAEYRGFYNTFEFKATLHNAAIRDALLDKQASYYQWDEPKLSSEREKSEQEASSTTLIFVSFYTPDRQNDNLTDMNSIWRVFLDSEGRRYVGKVQKSRKLLAELKELFPYHTRWNTPYTVTFDVPTSSIERAPSRFTITGPLGAKVVDFPAQQQ